MCSTHPFPMGSDRTKKWFVLLLTIVLFVQSSIHTIHVFTQHSFDFHSEHDANDSQIDENSTSCELCAKLLGQTFLLQSSRSPLIAIPISVVVIGLGELIFESTLRALSRLRGPPVSIRY